MIRLVLRSLTRNRWRSVLTLGGIAVGVGLIVWLSAFIGAYFDVLTRGVTAGQLGQLQLHDADYAERPDFWDTLAADSVDLSALEASPAVAAAAPRVSGFGLIGHQTRSQVAMVLGVDPVREPRVTVVESGVTEGRWLGATVTPGAAREVVLGRILASQLGVTIGEELVINVQTADGAPGDDLAQVIGIVRTGNADMDRAVVYMRLEDAQALMALDGRYHEIAFGLARGAALEDARAALAALVPEGATLRTWRELVPDLVQMLDMSEGTMWVFYSIIFALIILGLVNTQRMSALERRRELAVLVAIGTTPSRLSVQLVLESLFICVVGATLGVALGAAVVAWHGHVGFDMGVMASGDGAMTFMGIAFDEPIYPVLDLGGFGGPIAALLVVALLAGLWPALKAARANPTTAISGRG